MAENVKGKENNSDRTEIKDLIKSGKAFSFVGDKIAKAFESEDGDFYIEAVASSDQEDLVGDIMTSKALKTMESEFVGKTVFMNHRTNVPDDVFGSIVEASITKSNGAQLLVFKIIVEKENEPAIKTWKVIKGGRVQLGTSVTVLVKSAKPNPNRKGGIMIDDVETIEHSIVGVPCNRESKTMAASASKALSTALKSKGTEEFMDNDTKVETADEIKDVATEETKEAAAPASEEAPVILFARSLTMGETLSAIVAAKAAGTELPVVEPIVVKGMFQEILEREPSFWELMDILNEVRWNLGYSAYLLKEGGSTDFSAILADWSEALDEFKAAALTGFPAWYDFAAADTSSKSIEALAVAVELEKSFQSLISVKELATDEETTKQLIAVGASILELAKQAGIPMEVPAVDVKAATASDVDVTATKAFKEVATRAETAEARVKELETKLSGTEEDLEVTKAGLKAAVEATNAALREPLHEGGKD